MSKVTWLGQVVPVPVPPAPAYVLTTTGIPPSSVALRTPERTVVVGGPRVLQLGQPDEPVKTDWGMFWGLLSVAGAALAAYHGYKRNHESTGSAVGWGVLGALFPVITVPVALAQGYGEPKGASENPASPKQLKRAERIVSEHLAKGYASTKNVTWKEARQVARLARPVVFASWLDLEDYVAEKWASTKNLTYDEVAQEIRSGASDNPVSRRGPEFAEVGVFEYEGVKYQAGGAFYDREHGVLAGYPGETAPHKSALYELVQFDGTPIVPLRLVKKYRGGFGGRSQQMYAWSATYDGRVFSGRNLGPNMFLRMRAGRSSK